MSDLASLRAVDSAASPQLPVDWYFDPRIYNLEQQKLFARGPGYLGHVLMTPNRGDYCALDWLGTGKALIHNDNGIELISNVCRHRQAVIFRGRGNSRNAIVCPIHRWTYGLDGKLLGAPHFPGNPCLNLARSPLTNWNGLLFNGNREVAADLAGLAALKQFDFSGFILDRIQIDEYQCNWKTFIEVYLEDYHVAPFHPGLGRFVDCNQLVWQFGDWHSLQVVGVHKGLTRPGSPAYKRWHEQVLRYGENAVPQHGAIWSVYYPNLMIEWYPHVLVISSIIPRGPEACTNVIEYYYPEEIALFEREFVEAEQAAYEETAREDAEICERMTQGRRALYQQGISETGPYQSPMEDGMLHFHEFLRRELGQD